MRILVLYKDDDTGHLRLAVRQHLYVFRATKRKHEILYWNVVFGIPKWLKSLPGMDAVVLHTGLLCMRWSGSRWFREFQAQLRWVADLDAVKIAIPQDEYDHSAVLDEWLYELGISAVFSNFGPEAQKLIYPLLFRKAVFHECFTGYIDEEAAEQVRAKLLPSEHRPFDIVYRATRLPYWFGRQGQLKHIVSQVVADRARLRGLRCDISTRVEDSVFGEQWLDFLGSGRAVIGCESGSSVLDPRGEIRSRIQEFCKAEPTLSYEEVSALMPIGWDEHRFVAISPRHFEAVITKTCQVLVEGRYNGVMEPWKHYIPIKGDLSNVDEALDCLRDARMVREIVERAYEEIYLSGRHTYRRFAEEIEGVVERLVDGRERPTRSETRTRDHAAWAAAGLRVRIHEQAHLACQALAALVRGTIALCLVMASRPLRRFLVRFLLRGSLRRTVSLGRLMTDLLRLALLERAMAGQLSTLPALSLAPKFERGERTLVFRSTPGSRQPGAEGAVFRAGEGAFDRIIWNHSIIGTHIHYPLWRSKLIPISLGPNGVYKFEALMQLAERFPEELWCGLLEPFISRELARESGRQLGSTDRISSA